jgi:regulator of replication initiation timing
MPEVRLADVTLDFIARRLAEIQEDQRRLFKQYGYVETKLTALDARMSALDAKLDMMVEELRVVAARLERLDERVGRLEDRHEPA